MDIPRYLYFGKMIKVHARRAERAGGRDVAGTAGRDDPFVAFLAADEDGHALRLLVDDDLDLARVVADGGGGVGGAGHEREGGGGRDTGAPERASKTEHGWVIPCWFAARAVRASPSRART